MAPSRGCSISARTARALLLLVALETARAQQQTSISLPASTQFNLTAGSSTSYRIAPVAAAAGARTVTYFVTLNICAPPEGVSLDILSIQPVLFASNVSTNAAPTRQAPNGAAAALAPSGFANITFSETVSTNQGMWLGVTAPDGGGTWEFELGASSTAPMHIVDQDPLFAYDDSDQTNAMLTGPTYCPAIDGTPAHMALITGTSSSVPSQLSLSSCYIRQATGLVPQTNITSSLTTRGVVALTAEEGATGQLLRRAQAGLTRNQYAVQGLTASTNYTVWGLEGTGQLTSTQAEGYRLYQPQYFRTKTSDGCRLVTNMAMCPQAAYAVPAPPTLSTADVEGIYAGLMAPHLSNFNVTLNAFSCGNPTQGHYSYVRTCADCLAAYTNWLCSVVMPRCDDVPASFLASADQATAQAEASDTNSSVVFLPPLAPRPFPQVPFSSTAPVLILRTDPSLSRTPVWGASALANLTSNNSTLASLDPTSPFPYAEPPPCSALCFQVQASCPPLISWSCPSVGVTLEAAYGQLQLLPPYEQQGGDQQSNSRGWGRPGDKYGNVFCNALGVDVLLAKRSEASRVVVGSIVVVAFTLFCTLAF